MIRVAQQSGGNLEMQTSLNNSSPRSGDQDQKNDKYNQPLLIRNVLDYPYKGNEHDRYKGHVVWAKMPRDPWWPCRFATPEEAEQLGPEQPGTKVVCFLGHRSLGVVKNDMILPYAEHYHKFAHKKQKLFMIGLEEADELVLRTENDSGTDFCMICHANDQQEFVLLCDRCNGEAHMFCLTPPLDSVPDDDWFCPSCEQDAPLTVMARRKKAAKERKQREEEEKKAQLAASKKKIGENSGEGINNSNATKSEEDLKGMSITLGKKRTRAPQASSSPDEQKVEKEKLTGLRLHFRVDTNRASVSKPKSSSSDQQNSSYKKTKITNSSSEEDASSVAGSVQKRKRNPIKVTSPTIQQRNAQAAEAVAASSSRTKKTDDSCFICGDGGDLVLCDFANCPRVYHNACLGNSRLDAAQPPGMRWFCPWHSCAACGVAETEHLAADGSPRANDSEKERQVENSLNLPPPATFSFDCRAVESLNGETVESEVEFARCCSCPMSLCSKHQNICVSISDVYPVTIPVCGKVNKNGYFACISCRGFKLAENSKTRLDLPGVVVSRTLLLAWSRLVNGHYHLVSPFLYQSSLVASDQDPGLNAPPSSSSVIADGESSQKVSCLDDIRIKIWKMAYTSLEQFISDVNSVMQLMKSKIASSREARQLQGEFNKETKEMYDIVTEAAGSISLVMDEIITKLRARLLRLQSRNLVENRMLMAWSRSEEAERMGMGSSNIVERKLHRWDEFSEQPFDNADSMSIEDWGRFLEASPVGRKLAPSSAPPNYYLGPRHEVEGIAALISAASYESQPATAAGQLSVREPRQPEENEKLTVDKFLDSLPPSKEEMVAMMHEQSRLLRNALQSHAKIRKGMERLYDVQESVVQQAKQTHDLSVGTFAECRAVAEYAMANRSLRAKVAQLQQQVNHLKADQERCMNN